MIQIISRVLKCVFVVAALIVIFSVFVMPTVFHLKPYVIMSGSMLPDYPVGAVCIINQDKVSPSEGDVISYDTEEKNILHRVVDITKDGYITKGDNNDVEDPEPVKQEQVCGTCVMLLPAIIGKIVMFFKSPNGYLLMGAIIVLLLISKLFYSVLDKNER